jgi:hypothetical protein
VKILGLKYNILIFYASMTYHLLALENGFDPAFFHSLLRLVKEIKAMQLPEKSVINVIRLPLPVFDWSR